MQYLAAHRVVHVRFFRAHIDHHALRGGVRVVVQKRRVRLAFFEKIGEEIEVCDDLFPAELEALPGQDGQELLVDMTEEQLAVAQRFATRGLADFLPKPFTAEALVTMVTRVTAEMTAG